MKGKNLGILVIAAAVFVLVAILTSRPSKVARPDAVGKPVLPGLQLNDIKRIVVASGGSTAVVASVDDRWVAPGTYGYPADFAKVRDTLIKLSELKVGQVARLSEEQRKTLKLTPPSAASDAAVGTLVTLEDAGSRPIASLIVGETRQRPASPSAGPYGGAGGYPDGQYLSPDAGKTVFLVKETLSDLSANVRDWLDTEVLSVNAADVIGVRAAAAGQPELTLQRPAGGGSLTLDGLAEDEEIDSSKLYGIESALSYLRFADVADPALAAAETGLEQPATFTAVTRNGQVFTARIGASPTNSTSRYVRFEVSLNPEPAPEGTNAPAATAADDRRKLEDETRQLAARLGPWTYLVESYKTDSMLVSRDSIVKKKEPPKPEEATEEDEDPDAPEAETPAPAPEPEKAP